MIGFEAHLKGWNINYNNIMRLYPHNQRAYEAVMSAFETQDRAAIVHATGTGKSYCAAAVVENFSKALVVAPNNYVLGETKKVCKEGTEFKTYSSITYNTDGLQGYDLIVLDEFHRSGAQEWGKGVQNLLDQNKGAKLLGVTATEVRYLDNMRNMADELFEGNVVSRLSLADAWVKRILKVPVYIKGLFTFGVITRELREKVMSYKHLTEDVKAEFMAKIEKARLDWAKAGGVAMIFRKHMPKDAKRIIVFCDSIGKLEELKVEVVDWLKGAGIKVHKTYTANVHNKNSEAEMAEFEENGFDGVKVMFSINMLNEGVHVPNVDAVVMLRPTTSRIIHLQQMGRCMTTDNKKSPVIFDLVDNLSNSDVVQALKKEYEEKVVALREESEGEGMMVGVTELPHFEIFDYVYESKMLIDNLKEQYGVQLNTYEDNLRLLMEFMEAHNRIPKTKRKGEANLGLFMYRYIDKPEVKALYDKYAKFAELSMGEKMKIVSEWCEKHGRLPKLKKDDEEERQYANFIKTWRRTGDPKMKELSDKYGYVTPLEREARMREAVLKFIKDNERLPSVLKKDEEILYTFFIRRANRRKDPEFVALKKKYGIKRFKDSTDEMFKELKEFCKEHGRLPLNKYHRGRIEGRLYRFMNKESEDPRIIQIKKEYGTTDKKFANRLAELKAYVEEYGYLPVWGGESNSLAAYWNRHKHESVEAMAIYKKYPTRGREK